MHLMMHHPYMLGFSHEVIAPQVPLCLLHIENIIWHHDLNCHCFAAQTYLYYSVKPKEIEHFFKCQASFAPKNISGIDG